MRILSVRRPCLRLLPVLLISRDHFVLSRRFSLRVLHRNTAAKPHAVLSTRVFQGSGVSSYIVLISLISPPQRSPIALAMPEKVLLLFFARSVVNIPRCLSLCLPE